MSLRRVGILDRPMVRIDPENKGIDGISMS